MIRVLSLFSGIGGFDLGFHRAGMTTIAHAEIDPQCNNVFRRHFPDSQEYTDVAGIDGSFSKGPDLICGGFPCQDLSVAGRRAGLAGERSGLWFEFERIIRDLSPRWIVIENVPGLLSSWSGETPDSMGVSAGPGREMVLEETSDLATVLDSISKLGYGYAYRILDLQWFRTPQRRRRIFIVGCFGDWRRASEVLFEREILPWDPPPSRESRSQVAASLTRGADSSGKGGYAGRRQENDVNIVGCLDVGRGGPDVKFAQANHPIPDVSPAMKARDYKGPSSDGDGDGLPLIPFIIKATNSNDRENHGIPTDRARCLDSTGGYSTNQGGTVVAFSAEDYEAGSFKETDIAQPITTSHDRSRAVPLTFVDPEICETLRPHDGGCNEPGRLGAVVKEFMGVRRLMPIECERLQGFPDNWTETGADGKTIKDSPRYRMLGNAVAVPVSEWIGKRIMEINK